MIESPRCPACPKSPPTVTLAVGVQTNVALYRCQSCVGVLAGPGAIAFARERYRRDHPLLIERRGPQRCRVCSARTSAVVPRCGRCAAPLALACPLCSREMAIVQVAGVSVDLCRGCEFAFFDRGELGHVTRDLSAWRRAIREVRRPRPASLGRVADGAADLVFNAPDVIFVGDAAQLAGDAALHAAQGLGGAASVTELGSATAASGEAVLELAAGAGEAAGATAEVVLEVLGGIFSL